MIFNYRYLLICLFTLLAFASCDNNKVDTKVDLTATSKQLITEHFRLLNEKDLKSIVAQYDGKARITSSNWDGVSFGQEGADQIHHQQFYLSPDAKYLIDNVIANDSTVIVEYDIVGLKDKANSTIRYDLRNCSIFKVKNNHINSEATYSNTRLYHNSN